MRRRPRADSRSHTLAESRARFSFYYQLLVLRTLVFVAGFLASWFFSVFWFFLRSANITSLGVSASLDVRTTHLCARLRATYRIESSRSSPRISAAIFALNSSLLIFVLSFRVIERAPSLAR